MASSRIIRPTPKWKLLLGIIAGLAALHLAVLLYAWCVTPDTRPRPQRWSEERIEAAAADRELPEQLDGEKTRVVLPTPEKEYQQAAVFFQKHPRASRETIERAVESGEIPGWYPRGEAPVLTSAGLPSVAERTGPEPVVMRGCEETGRYGGSWVFFVTDLTVETANSLGRISADKLFRFSPQGYPIVPHIAKGYEKKEGGRIWEIELRKIRWSDGAPFTADDVLYQWNDEMLCKSLGGGTHQWHFTVGGKPAELEKIDDHRVRFTFPEPRTDFLEMLAYINPYAPQHYMRQFHPDHGDPEFLDAMQKKYNMPNRRALYNLFNSTNNPERPSLRAWIYRKHSTISPITYVRNPYYFAVDEEGNQLPYIDRIQAQEMAAMMIPLAISNGQASMQFRYLRFENYTEFAERAGENKFRVLSWLPGTGSEWLIYPNINRAVTDTDPGSEFKKRLLEQKEFRQALSLAINRRDVIRALYAGLAKPQQVDPGPWSRYPSEKLRHAYTAFDPDQANRLLDGIWRDMGLDPALRKGSYRCDEAGRPVTFYLMFTDFTGAGPVQFVVDDWAKVGIRCIYQQYSRPLIGVRKATRNFDFYIWSSESDLVPVISPRLFVPTSGESAYAIGWSLWYQKGGFYDDPRADSPGSVPIPREHPMYRVVECYEALLRSDDPEQSRELFREITDIAAENLWTINVAADPPKVVVASEGMRNVPAKAVEANNFSSPGHTAPETFFFLKPDTVADADTLQQLLKATPLPPAVGESGNAGQIVLRTVLIAIAGLFLLLLILKHPFVLRRLAIMVPTLLLISIAVFTIIQLPPGDYLTNRIMQLEESGTSPEQIELQIDDLRKLFHFDDPAWKRYCRWMGFLYFFSFDSKDAGLLQGNMGYSMETSKSVNSMVGDRILLTFLISLGTVILTWSLALPIGIYSACRQYSMGDYFFTVLGFLGMCVPGFLLALILMALTGVSGLFSPEFVIQPHWSWPKVLDLLKHIWVPVLVVGISGTAGMIRVMRANLLDELGKPYVTTARAKGVPPLRLLFKYPVRLALNPFISGIGGLFPSLVSGSSIVAIVMSLPTVGPLLLSALFSQDMNVAGSMLMILSLLGVFGTLVSDLLLMMVDPRIRLEGGNTR